MKAWLIRINDKLGKVKTIFETLVAASLTVMGVLVSIAAVIVSVNANRLVDQQNELIKQQYDLDRYGAEPVFEVHWEEGEDGVPCYIIKNIGAEIHNVRYWVSAYMRVYYRPLEEDGAKFLVEADPNDTLEYTWDIDTNFDEQTQSFHIAALRWFQEETPSSISEKLNKLEHVSCGEDFIEIDIYYRNYLNETCQDGIHIWNYNKEENQVSFDIEPLTDGWGDCDAIWVSEDPSKEIQEVISEYFATAT